MVEAESKNNWVEMGGGKTSKELFDISENYVVEQLFAKDNNIIVIKKEKSGERFIVETDMEVKPYQKYSGNIKGRACERAEKLMQLY